MLLVVDIGNTNITLGLYKDEEIIGNYRLTTWFKRTSDEYGFMINNFLQVSKVDVNEIEDVIISSVVPKIMHSFTNSIRKYINKEPIIVGPGIKTGISVKTENPKKVGADRIVDLAGCYYTYGGNALVIDLGTATTYDYISSDGVFKYGVTAPGIGITAEALSEKCAKLPEIEIVKPETVLASETTTSMQAGLFYGYLGSVEYIIKKFKEELGADDMKVIATGGLGKLISENTDLIDIYDRDLTFKGLKVIYEKNKN